MYLSSLSLIFKSNFLRLLLLIVTFIGVLHAGSFDTTFGTGGKVTLDVALTDFVRRVFVLPDGKILVAGEGFTIILGNSAYWPFVARFNSNGTLDTTFGSSGKVFDDGGFRVQDIFVKSFVMFVFVGGIFSCSVSVGFFFFRPGT